jgi:hypothetical protein
MALSDSERSHAEVGCPSNQGRIWREFRMAPSLATKDSGVRVHAAPKGCRNPLCRGKGTGRKTRKEAK